MGEGITLTINADTQAAAANLSTFFQNLQRSLDGLSGAGGGGIGERINTATTAASQGMGELRHTSMLTREAFHGLEATTLLLGGARMPMLAEGVMAGRMALMTLRSAAALTGISLGTLAPVLGVIGIALGAGVLLWRSYTSETEKAAKAQQENLAAMERLPGLLGQINDLLKARRLSAEAANEYSDYLTGKKKLYKGSNGELTPNPTEMQEGATIGMGAVMGPVAPSMTRIEARPIQLPEASLGEAQDFVRKQLEGKGGIGDTSIQAITKLQELERSARDDSLSGLKKEEAEIHTRYEKEREEITATMDLAKLSMTPKEAQAGKDALAQSEKNEAGAIIAARFKQQQEDLKQADEAFTKRKEELATQAKAEQEKLERELTLLELQEGEKRGQNYTQAYQQRIKLAESQYYAGEIGENEYTQLVEDATIKRLEARRKEAEEAIRLQKEQEELAKKQFALQEEQIKNDPYTSEVEKARELLPLLQKQYDLTRAELAQVQGQLANPNLSGADRGRLQNQQVDLQKQGAGLSDKIASAQDLTSFSGQFKRVITDLENQWGSWAKQAADGFANVFNSAISSISKGITGLIMGTMTWQKALVQIGQTIVTDVVQAIIQMITRWAAMQALMAVGLPIGFSGGGFTGYASGGYTGGGGAGDVAGVVHRGEFVFSAPAVRGIGLGRLAEMHRGYASGGPVDGGGNTDVRVHIWGNNEKAMLQEIQRSSHLQHVIVDMVAKQAHKFR